MKNFSSKHALLLSVLSMVICVSMLIGSTFAWFTDSATANVNTIKSGNLDVALEMKDNDGNWVTAENKTLQFLVDGKIPAAGTKILWEPGCTYSLPELRVVNGGDLALKYKIVITGITGDTGLNEVITWTINDAPINLTEKTLLAKEEGEAFTIKGHMLETADNNYMGKTIENISITVYATQMASEFDSNGNTYDDGAEYFIPENDITAIKDTLANGGKVTLGTDVKSDSNMKMTGDTSVDLNGKTWTVGDNTKLNNGASLTVSGGNVISETYSGYVSVRPGSSTDSVVTYTDVNFTGTYNAGRGTRGSSTTHTDYVVKFTPEAGGHTTFVFKNCTFTNSAIQFSGLSGNDGTFDVVFENCKFTALTNDAVIEVGSYLTNSNITVKDCTFDITATSNFSIIDGNYGRAATVTFEGENTFNAVVATPTGADKEGTAEEIKIFSENLNVKVCSAKTVNGLDTVSVSGIATK